MKYNMAKRVFDFLRNCEYTENQWFSPSATYLVVQREFDFLVGRGDPKWKIHGFYFSDDYEKDFLAHMITVCFLACGVLHTGKREFFFQMKQSITLQGRLRTRARAV